jgi:hypothetical protein
MKRSKAPAVKDVSAALRATQAVQLRAQGLTYEEIASRAGYASRGAAHNAVQRALAEYRQPIIEDARKLEEMRLDMLLASIWPQCFDREETKTDKEGNEKREKKLANLFAVDRVLAIAERRAKLLGLDTPVQSGVVAAQIIIRQANFDPAVI